MLKKHLILAFFLFLLFIAILPSALAALPKDSADRLNIYFFWANGCPHCEKEKDFLSQIRKTYPFVKVTSLEVTGNQENLHILRQAGETLGVEIRGVPFTVIGRTYIVGWYDDSSSGAALERAIKQAISEGCDDVVGEIIATEETGCQGQPEKAEGSPETINVPLIGQIAIGDISLPLLTIIMGAIDGFNPCAMWVLIFLISLLLGMNDRRRMWILGIAFIASSAIVYFLFMVAWLNLFLFLGFLFWVRAIVGGVALASGGYNIREFFLHKEATCLIEGDERKKKLFERLKNITGRKEFWAALLGVILLAAAVNLVELICSAGLPAVYTQVLSLSELPVWLYYAYIGLYILIFMLDDLIVFIIAMKTLEIIGATNRFSRYSHLVGGAIMVLIGLLLWFKPGWLMFG